MNTLSPDALQRLTALGQIGYADRMPAVPLRKLPPSDPRPPRTAADLESFQRLPQEIKAVNQWVVWCKEIRDGKPTKIPYQVNGQKANSADPGTWTSFAEALGAYRDNPSFAGIGFVFKEGGPDGGIDFDHCIRADGTIEPWAQELLGLLRCVYAEISPSGTGIKAIGKVPPGSFLKHKRTGYGPDGTGAVEFYQTKRFFTITANAYGPIPEALADDSGLLAVYNRVFPAKPTKFTKPPKPGHSRLTDEAVIALIQQSQHASLYAGDKAPYNNDDSAADLALCNTLAFYTSRDPEQMDRVFRTSKLYRQKWDRQDYRDRTISKAIADCTETYGATAEAKREAKAQAIIELATEYYYFNDNGAPYVVVPFGNQRRVMSVPGEDFAQHLSLVYYKSCGKGASTTSIKEAQTTLSAKAVFDGPNERVELRIAHRPDRIYLDLNDAEQQVVEIRPGAWRVIPSAECPVHFLRPKSIGPLPVPVVGGSLEELRPLLPPGLKKSSFSLILYWLIAFFVPTGTMPLLFVLAAHGSGKSYMQQLLASLIDPGSDLISPPKNEEDLIVASLSSAILRIDNLSAIPMWLSDALCRVASGSEFVTRRLYTNGEAYRAKVRRAISANGIPADLVTKPDLRDRAVIINLPLIDGKNTKYRSESSLRAEFDQVHPRVLGALLTAVATAMERRSTIDADLPRMGESYAWMLAAQPAMPTSLFPFTLAYRQDREASVRAALANSVVGTTILELMAARDVWQGTCKDLLAEIDDPRRRTLPGFGDRPKNATALAAEIDRLVPALAVSGIRHERSGRKSFGVVHQFKRDGTVTTAA